MLLFLFFPGCGYTLRHRLKESFTRAPGIFVPVFSNATEETGAERVFTDALIRELQSRGEVVLTTRQAGGLELLGTVSSIDYAPTTLSDAGFQGLQPYRRLPAEFGINVVIALELIDLEKKQTLWGKSFSGFRRVAAPLNRTYNFQAPSSIGLYSQSLVESQFSDIAADIMRDVYDEMVELF